jgi:hypothetical protein
MRTMFGSRGRTLLFILLIAGFLFTAAQYIPAYFSAFQLNDFVRQEVKYAGTSRKNVDALRDEIVQKANDLGIPITKKDIRVTKRGPSFTLEVDYRWPIDMKVYRHTLVFHTEEIGENFENASN